MTELAQLRRKFRNYEKELDKAIMAGLYSAGLEMEATAKRSITEGGKTGRVYQRRSVTHQASAPGQAPASDTGRLVQSINLRTSSSSMAIEIVAGGGSGNVRYANALEFGTKNILPRPFMHPAYMENRKEPARQMSYYIDKELQHGAKHDRAEKSHICTFDNCN